MTTTTPDVVLPTWAQKYVAALLSFVNVVAAPIIAFSATTPNATAIWQFAVLIAAAVGTYWVPLAPKGWAGLFKTLVALVIGIGSALIPVVSQQWNAANVLLIVSAVIQVLVAALGVKIRTDPEVAPQAGNVYQVTNVTSPVPPEQIAN
jgi:hypothetical protein